MSGDPFEQVIHALEGVDPGSKFGSLRLDPARAARTGIPEVVLAGHKSTEQVATSLIRLADAQGRSLASRVRPDQFAELASFIPAGYALELDTVAATAIVVAPQHGGPQPTGGRVAILAAGASDIAVAFEATTMAREMGAEVRVVIDVGVAGLHRLIGPLRDLMSWEPHAIVVAAGMDGALPSVIAGLVPVPVVGLPVSVGYGYGGDGTGALMS
ncbi:MAG TPA: AIR carboxylase family protein, partial [Thermomicrobiales bacterium]|nr:AIR carboxylase family protein [Thermomicrobiales bacterium]